MEADYRVQKSIQRVLTRLDQGEDLICDTFCRDGKFCAMGILVDEADLFDIQEELLTHEGLSVRRIDEYVSYYNLNSPKGEFDISEISPDLKTRIQKVAGLSDHEVMSLYSGHLSLTVINDSYFHNPYPTKPAKLELNSVLADVIRSGAIFRKPA